MPFFVFDLRRVNERGTDPAGASFGIETVGIGSFANKRVDYIDVASAAIVHQGYGR